ncbi:YigZ family protein [uncultured Eudoraea sp.]|uniref:IMPACT family protein n=1 Tax=uncultured Eudoraea sp. TaxID=1035614 RepID=UPI00263965D5|nr:YigZ family protein [uncultured Eudoraea sp.]
MENNTGLYKTISKASAGILYKEQKSKFYAYTFPVAQEGDIKPILEDLRRKHPTANHICYAWRIGIENQRYRANDDGEPNNSAGIPIFGQIKSFGLTNVLIAVVRIFGGTKLGVGGLISAYRTSAKYALESSEIVVKSVQIQYELRFVYPLMSGVMRIIKSNAIEIMARDMDIDCTLLIAVNVKEVSRVENQLRGLKGVSMSKIEG